MNKAVVLLSGGLDSATALALAVRHGFDCHALSVSYGQRHRAELEAATRVAAVLGASQHRVIVLSLPFFGGSALTDKSIQVPTDGAGIGIPNTYVPAPTPYSFPLPWLGQKCWGPAQSLLVPMQLTIQAIPIADRSICRPSRRWRTSRRALRWKATRSESMRRW